MPHTGHRAVIPDRGPANSGVFYDSRGIFGNKRVNEIGHPCEADGTIGSSRHRNRGFLWSYLVRVLINVYVCAACKIIMCLSKKFQKTIFQLCDSKHRNKFRSLPVTNCERVLTSLRPDILFAILSVFFANKQTTRLPSQEHVFLARIAWIWNLQFTDVRQRVYNIFYTMP